MYFNSFVQGCNAELDRIPFPTIQTARYVKVSILEYEDDGAAITYIGVETVVGKNISNNSAMSNWFCKHMIVPIEFM